MKCLLPQVELKGNESPPINKNNDTISTKIQNRDAQGRFVKATAATPMTRNAQMKENNDMEELPLFHPNLAKLRRTTDRNSKPTKIKLYDGNAAGYNGFTQAIDLRFLQYPDEYSSELDRITCITEHCSGRAGNWCFAILNDNSNNMTDNYSDFIEGFENSFNDREFLGRMSSRDHTKHVKGSVAEFATECEEAAHVLGYTSNVIGPQFQEHMRPEICRELIRSPTIDQCDYQQVRAFCVRLDTNLEQERRQLQLQAPRQYQPQQIQARQTPSAGACPRITNDQKAEQKSYRLANDLCLFSGSPGHRIGDCPYPARRPLQLRRMNVQGDVYATDPVNVSLSQ
ncbi:unnamed protein product [Blumeria hordei]|uniref:Retrotransposon gag domain-containing protein n=1 Tax=Blumeria hordei TaxID=2867405 RepID=A0A383UHY1_BLUHO|nr:unnamed protein product [Blumeria hordei]